MIPTRSIAPMQRLLRFGKWMWMQTLGGLLFSVVDRLVVGAAFGASDLARYSICMQLAQLVHGVQATALQPIFPWVTARLASPQPVSAAMLRRIAVFGGLACLIAAHPHCRCRYCPKPLDRYSVRQREFGPLQNPDRSLRSACLQHSSSLPTSRTGGRAWSCSHQPCCWRCQPACIAGVVPLGLHLLRNWQALLCPIDSSQLHDVAQEHPVRCCEAERGRQRQRVTLSIPQTIYQIGLT